MQYAVYRNFDGPSSSEIPFLLDLQSDLLSPVASRVVAPLVLADAFGPPLPRLNPLFEIDGIRVVLSALEIQSVTMRRLGPPVANLSHEHDAIVAAVDMVFHGF